MNDFFGLNSERGVYSKWRGWGDGLGVGREAVEETPGANPLAVRKPGTPDWGFEGRESQGPALGSGASWRWGRICNHRACPEADLIQGDHLELPEKAGVGQSAG